MVEDLRDPARYGRQTGAVWSVHPFERIPVRTPPKGAEGLGCTTSLAGRGCSRVNGVQALVKARLLPFSER
jgi:hypothetical protein